MAKPKIEPLDIADIMLMLRFGGIDQLHAVLLKINEIIERLNDDEKD